MLSLSIRLILKKCAMFCQRLLSHIKWNLTSRIGKIQELRVDAWDGNLKASEDFLFPPVSVVSSELGAHLWDWCNFTVLGLCCYLNYLKATV